MPRARFKVQDLLIDVVAQNLNDLGQICYFPTDYCPFLTLNCPDNTFILCVKGGTLEPCRHGITLDCLLTNDGCGVNYSTCWQTDLFIIDVEQLVINPQDIGLVREQVESLLNAASARGKEIHMDMQPQNLAQVEVLEEQLDAALKEVRKLKKRFG